MSQKVYRTAIYARLSKDDGDKVESNSIVSQKALCQEYIQKHPELELVETFVDDGYSGVNFDRPRFKAMEDAIRKGRIDCVLCKDLSRFTRNYIEGGRYLERIFPQLGVRFIAINDSYDSLTGDPQSDSFIIPFKNLINDTYCKDISVKIRTNLDVKRRKGEFVGAYTPYGYIKDPENHNHLIIDEYAGEIVQKIFALFKDGFSISRIADRLNELGVLSPMEYKLSCGINYDTVFKLKDKAKWSYTSIQRILTNEVYIGMMVQGKQSSPNYKVHVMQPKDESEWIRVEGTHDALITYDDFMAVKTMLGRDMRSTSDDSLENLLSGFVFCGDCGQPMTRKTIPGSGGRKYYYYVCSKNKRREGCTTHSINQKEVESAVLSAVREHINHVLDLADALEYIDRMPSTSRAAFNYESIIAKLEEEIEKYQKMKLRLYEDLADGVITKKEYMEFRNQYAKLIEDKQAALERVQREYKDSCIAGKEIERTWVSMFRQYENVEELNRRVLMALVDKVLIYEDHVVEVCFKFGDEFQRSLEYASQYADELPMAI